MARTLAASAGPDEAGYSQIPTDSPRPTADDSHLDILQFSSAIYYLSESEGKLDIDIMRLGPMTSRVACKYKTVDGSGKEGVSYVQAEGELVLEAGEPRATFTVNAIPDETWSPTMEFGVQLFDPQNCQLGVYLKFCRVKCLNDDAFPTSAFDKESMQDGDIPVGFKLWREYAKLNYQQPGMAWRTWFVVIVDQLKNLNLYFKLWFNVYLVDVVLNSRGDVEDRLLIHGNREATILLMGLLWILPNIILHLWDVSQLYIGVKSRSFAFLQEALFREYLNFSEKSRSEVMPSDMIVCVSADCGDVAGSYCTAMNMVSGLVKIGILANFILHHNPRAFWVMGVMPSITITFSLCRLSQQMRVSTEAGDAEIRMMSLVNEVCQKYRLVADYMQRPYINQIFTERTAFMRSKKRPEVLVFMNNEYFPSFLGFLFVGIYISTASNRVVEGTVSLGTYLATISVFKDVADAFSGIYGNFVSLTKSFEPLGGLTELYNKRTDLEASMKIARMNREESKKERTRLLNQKDKVNSSGVRYLTDLMQIRLENMTVRYDKGDPIFEDVSISVEQGKLIAVTGLHGTGRATLLRVFGKVIFPDEGGLTIVPTHLRTVHISKEPILMRMSLWDNLAFGLQKTTGADQDTEVARVMNVLKLFGPGTLEAVLKDEMEKKPPPAEGEEEEEAKPDGQWQEKLTSLDRAIVHLARGVIMNPEILVLQRPLSNFSVQRAMEVLDQVFVAFVQEKGVCLPEKGREDRRPRTLFYVPESTEQVKRADVVWAISVKNEKTSKTIMRLDTLDDPKQCVFH